MLSFLNEQRFRDIRHRDRYVRNCVERARRRRRANSRRDGSSNPVASLAPFCRRAGSRCPAHVQRAIGGVVALLRGEKRDLNDVTNIDGLPEFNRKVLAVPDPGGLDTDVRRNRGTAWRQTAGARGRTGAGRERNSLDCALSPRAGCRRQDRWLLRAGRRCRQAASADHRRRATGRSDIVRRSAARRQTRTAFVNVDARAELMLIPFT